MKRMLSGAALVVAFVAGLMVSNYYGVVQGQQKKAGEGFAAVPGGKGGHDAFGPYDPVQNWPRPLLTVLSFAHSFSKSLSQKSHNRRPSSSSRGAPTSFPAAAFAS